MLSRRTANILVIENDPGLREWLRSSLKNPCFKVSGVADYFEAVWHLEELEPDLFIIGEKLPLIDGWEACCQLRRACAVPVMLVGRETDANVWLRALRVGADFYLRMPCGPLELAARVRAVIRRYKREEALPLPAYGLRKLDGGDICPSNN